MFCPGWLHVSTLVVLTLPERPKAGRVLSPSSSAWAIDVATSGTIDAHRATEERPARIFRRFLTEILPITARFWICEDNMRLHRPRTHTVSCLGVMTDIRCPHQVGVHTKCLSGGFARGGYEITTVLDGRGPRTRFWRNWLLSFAAICAWCDVDLPDGVIDPFALGSGDYC